VFIPAGGSFRPVNTWEQIIVLPEPIKPNQKMDLFWLMVAGEAAPFGPLPDGIRLDSGSMIAQSGIEYAAEVVPISNLTNLLTSSTNDSSISWDLEDISPQTGNFYLASTTVPFSDLVPEPSPEVLTAIGPGKPRNERSLAKMKTQLARNMAYHFNRRRGMLGRFRYGGVA